MIKLTSLTISNLRRFGPKVDIDFSPGATILLAPNGTGKTAVFEAIELALTGAVERLQDDLSPIIRDGSDQAIVRLRFGGLAERTVELRRGGQAHVQGDLTPIFGDTDAADLPFLLRLTHLLDQRESNWFVHAEAKVAGSQLAKLPIGRDGARAISVLGPARKQTKEQLNLASEKLDRLRAELEEWDRLLQERDESVADLERPLIPQVQLSGALESAAERLGGTRLPLLTGVEALADACDVLQQGVFARIGRIDARVVELSGVAALPSSFATTRDRLSRLRSEVATAASATEAQREAVAQFSSDVTKRASQITVYEQRRNEIAQSIAKLAEEAKAKGELALRKQKLGESDAGLAAAEAALITARDSLQSIERVVLLHEGLRSKHQVLLEVAQSINESRELIERWQEVAGEIDATRVGLEEARQRLEAASKTYQVAVTNHAQCERAEAEARNKLRVASDAADSVRRAVAMVAAHLTPDREDCPVCGVHHGADALRDRVQASLNAIDPLLGTAERELHAATEILKRSEMELSESRDAVQAARSAVSQIEGQHAALEAESEAIRASRLFAADSVESARKEVSARIAELDLAKQNLAQELDTAPDPVPLEELTQAKAALHVADQRFEQARQLLATAQVELDHATQVYAAARDGMPDGTTMQELSILQSDVDGKLAALRAAHLNDAEGLSRLQSELYVLDARANELEQQLATVASGLAAIQASWKRCGLPGDPSAEVAAAVEAQLASERAVLERQSVELEFIEAEVTRWQRAERHRMAQSILDRRRGSLSEASFSEQLAASVKQGAASVQHLSQVSRALETLSSLLSREIGNIHDHVVAVVPRWRDLLKRIVRDQRFAQTQLDFYSHYRKEHASVTVPLNGAAVPAPTVASEAQMTDLQLTFLLAMATSHRWSPWRALLLDDPTQHHDLVHAASVFDVLRDFITDHGFQVVMATHDALQARFLMRKLQNDGVPCRLWALTPAAEGVMAVASK